MPSNKKLKVSLSVFCSRASIGKKQALIYILRKLADSGVSVVIVSRDIEFCAEYADRCALFFDGSIVTENAPREFFSGNSFYSTNTARYDIWKGEVAILNIKNGNLPKFVEIC